MSLFQSRRWWTILQRTLFRRPAGAALGLAAASIMRNQLFGVTPTDLPTYLGVFGLLTAASLMACYLPARRAARISPVQALREE